eukprot:9472776-Pyramimonas_sp.AAC.1
MCPFSSLLPLSVVAASLLAQWRGLTGLAAHRRAAPQHLFRGAAVGRCVGGQHDRFRRRSLDVAFGD